MKRRRSKSDGRPRRRDRSEAGASASSAGGYPFLRTGHLRRNIQMEMDRPSLTARVGTNVLYGRYLEFGTRKMKPRPWLSLALQQFGPRLREILEADMSAIGPEGGRE